MTPLFLTNDGKIWKAMCMVSLSNSFFISKENSDVIFEYDLSEFKWIKIEKKKLSPREYEILSLYVGGLKINEIAQKLLYS